jgi:ketosteroid isomerase-like protein
MTDNKKVISGLYDAFDRGDIPTVLAALAPDASWTEAEGFPYGGTYIGPAEILANVFMKLGTEWDGWAAVPHELISEGDTVVALGEYSGTYKESGKSFKAPFVHVWKLKDGVVQKFVQHSDTVLVRDAM